MQSAEGFNGAVQYTVQTYRLFREHMENVLAKTKQAVSRYKSRSQSDNLNATKSVWAAVRFLRKQLPALEKQDRGVTTRVARELSDLLSKLPMFKHLREDKEASENLHSKPQAEELIVRLENQLKTLVKDLENSKIDEIRGWVENHPVLGVLTKTLTRKMPDSTYVFLFRQTKGGNLELVTSRSPDGRVFTRFRPREFFDVKKLYRLYNHRPPVGAAVVVDNKLQDVIGTVPQPGEGEDQLHVISALSKEAASQPAKAFMSSNPVLQKLHALVKERKVDKNAYILLFVEAHEELEFDAELDEELESGDVATSGDDERGDENSASSDDSTGDENVAGGENAAGDENAAGSEDATGGDSVKETAQTESATEASSAETSSDSSSEDTGELPVSEVDSQTAGSGDFAAKSSSTDEIAKIHADASEASPGAEETTSTETTEDAAEVTKADGESAEAAPEASEAEDGSTEASAETSEPDSENAETSSKDESGSDTAGDASQNAEAEEETAYYQGPVEILTRAGSDGGVLTRYYGNEFSDIRKVFESFASQRAIAGAAVVKGRELLQVIGTVPQPHEGRSQLDVLISESNHAADKPTRDFMADNEILNSLHELATGDFDSHAKVLLFIEEEGRLSALVPPPPPQRDERGRPGDRRGGRDRNRGRDNRGRDDRNADRGRSGKASLLADFRHPRDIRNGFKNLPRVVGASVIGEFKGGQPQRKEGGHGGDNRGPSSRDDKRGRDNRGPQRPQSKSVVLAAFGRTPLKQNILITEETTRRLGLDSSLIY